MATAIFDDNTEDDHLKMFRLIWLDSNPNEYRNIEPKLRSTINHLKQFQDVDQCQQYIEESSQKDRLLLIVNGQLGRKLVPHVHQLQQVACIYIYCIDREANQQWFSKYSKVKCIVTDVDRLLFKITYDHRIRQRIRERLTINSFSSNGKSTTNLNGQFVFFQVLIECLLKLKSTDEDRNELIAFYQREYKQNKNELKKLEEFKKYSSDNAVWWYTRESFFYRTINAVLRTENIHMMFLLRSYIFDIQQQLQKYQFNNTLKVYRSQIMSQNEFEILIKSIGQLNSINSFFSTSQDREFTIHMLGETNSSVDWIRILFEIDADPTVIKTKPFADISQLSDFPNESEILFMTGSIFRINKIEDHKNQFWIVQMTLCNENKHDVKDVLNEMRKQIGKDEINLRTLARIVWDMGKFDLAERYFIRLLKQLSLNDPLVGHLYEDLGKLTSQMEHHDQSIEWRRKLILFEKENPMFSAIKPTDNLVQIQNDDLKLYEEIGSGGFGVVYRANWLTYDISIAVKKLHPTHLNKDAEQTFFNELSLLNRVRHPHIVSFYGACLEKGHYALIMEYMSLGSLYQLLHVKKVELSWSDRYIIALQAARGINCLHQCQPLIIHRDIKSLNFLLEKSRNEYLVKVCDFGMAKTRHETTQQSKTTISLVCTAAWAASEIWQKKSHTVKSDIYSLGIVYWEIASNRIPYDGCEEFVIRGDVLNGKREPIPHITPLDFRTIIEKCWKQEPHERPTSTDLLEMLKECIQKQSKSP